MKVKNTQTVQTVQTPAPSAPVQSAPIVETPAAPVENKPQPKWNGSAFEFPAEWTNLEKMAWLTNLSAPVTSVATKELEAKKAELRARAKKVHETFDKEMGEIQAEAKKFGITLAGRPEGSKNLPKGETSTTNQVPENPEKKEVMEKLLGSENVTPAPASV